MLCCFSQASPKLHEGLYRLSNVPYIKKRFFDGKDISFSLKRKSKTFVEYSEKPVETD